ncbi:MAG: hypothetical protein QQW96_03800 [Tychonema bourrellyi B0820]|nr:hypothetical protein [Tychonema bourrellyi B0820]PJE45237.1 MAG: hypothetical protein CUR32_01150 [Flavobacterium sp.] [Flavobacterium sp. FEMGT703F]
MIRFDRETEKAALKLRDAFRIIAWQSTAFAKYELDEKYTKFGDFWHKSYIRSMNYFLLTEFARELGFSVDELLTIRSNYYGLTNLPQVVLSPLVLDFFAR